MDKEDLIKLAKIAGYGLDFNKWQPHKDISQAMEVLLATGKSYCISHYKVGNPQYTRHLCEINGEYSGEYSTLLPEAICQSVLKATGGRR